MNEELKVAMEVLEKEKNISSDTLFDAIELNVFISATVTLIPIISNKTPIPITINSKIMLNTIPTFDITVSDKNEKAIDIKKAVIVIVSTHFKSTIFFGIFFLSTFLEYFSLYFFFSIIVLKNNEMATNMINSVP